MRRIRQAHTVPELAVRRALTRLGIRYRVCVTNLPGRPDIVNRSQRWAIFVHGCFWHGHEGCTLFTRPKTNRAFWSQKIVANRERDARKEQALRDLGYHVETIWQCETEDPTKLAARLVEFARSRGEHGGRH